MIYSGDLSVSYLNTRARFNWNEVDFSVFSTYSMITSTVGKTSFLQHTVKM